MYYETKAYVPCLTTLIASKMKQNDLGITPNMIMLADLMPLPVFGKANDSSIYVSPKKGWLTGYNREKSLGFFLSKEEFEDFNFGLENILMDSKESGFSIITGTLYWSPWSSEFMREVHIENYGKNFLGLVNHWVAFQGLDDKNNALIFETTPKRVLGKLSLEMFEKFWQGYAQFEILKKRDESNKLLRYGKININISEQLQKIDISDLYCKLWKIYVDVFDKGIKKNDSKYTYYFGKIALGNYIEYFSEKKLQTNKIYEYLAEISISKNILENIIKECMEYNFFPINIHEKSSKLCREWYKLLIIIQMKIADSSVVNTRELIDKLNVLIALEKEIVADIRKVIEVYG